MKNIFITLSLLVIAAALSACAGGSWSQREKWEGVKEKVLRVYVHCKTLDDDYYDSTLASREEKIDDSFFLKRAQARAAFLVSQWESFRGNSEKPGTPRVDYSSAKIVHKKCYDTCCEAYIDFVITR
ncbi:MAG TPA: hypothetical protein PK926_12970 [Spirochaetota bacterium]|nr:hypothetical protein [Spirochaetota bacterium]HPI89546.1 hypothetical protein [Spirochaetota bacterium]HPR49010.1 hypothetical protein [Spirochaetota bacterium]